MKTYILLGLLVSCAHTLSAQDTLKISVMGSEESKRWQEFVLMFEPIVETFTDNELFLSVYTITPSMPDNPSDMEKLVDISLTNDLLFDMYRERLRSACIFFGNQIPELDTVDVVCFYSLFGAQVCYPYPHDHTRLVETVTEK